VRLIDADKIEFHGLNNRVCPDLSAMDVIDGQPTILAVPVVFGEWEPRNWHSTDVICSECSTLQTNRDSNYKTRYCPSCGANMTKRDKEGR
jgi:predicted RNA-binding Zn-ribbon protein involved in translation (DUF1610 family)